MTITAFSGIRPSVSAMEPKKQPLFSSKLQIPVQDQVFFSGNQNNHPVSVMRKLGLSVLLAAGLPMSVGGCGGGGDISVEPPSGGIPTAPVEPPAPAPSEPTDEQVLQARPLPPTDINLFSPAVFPGAAPLASAEGPAITDAYPLIAEYFKNADPLAFQRAIELYYDQSLITKIPNPTLRAALTGLLGTTGEPALNFIRNAKTEAGMPKVRLMGFDDNPWDPSDAGVARTVVDPVTQEMVVVFNPKYRFENPFHFTSFMPHESLHSDTKVSSTEEVIALALQSYIYLQQLSGHPALATGTTELARRNNTNALTRLNSGTGSSLGLFTSNANRPILPGSPLQITNWFAQFQNQPGFGDTPGNELLNDILSKMTVSSPAGENPGFTMETISYLDQNSPFSVSELIAAAKALKLNTDVSESNSVPRFA